MEERLNEDPYTAVHDLSVTVDWFSGSKIGRELDSWLTEIKNRPEIEKKLNAQKLFRSFRKQYRYIQEDSDQNSRADDPYVKNKFKSQLGRMYSNLKTLINEYPETKATEKARTLAKKFHLPIPDEQNE